MSKYSFSVFIQTLNEEKNIKECIECYDGWTDDIVVLDSLSSDKTKEIAESLGARWFERPYDGRASNQNWAVDNINFKYPWVYYTDADERVPRELAKEISELTSDSGRCEVAYQVNRRDYFQDKWLRRTAGYPLRIIRLFKPDKIRWERKANPIPVVDGPVGLLKNDYIHFPFSKGLSDWVARHNKYSTFEAEETIRSLAMSSIDIKSIFSFDPVLRRRSLKELSFRLPFRPLFKFLYLYFLKAGFLDGRPGFNYCMLQVFYEFLIVLKVQEINAKK